MAKLFQKYCEQVFSQLFYLIFFVYLKIKWTSFVFQPLFWEIYSKIKWMFGLNTMLFGLQQARFTLLFSFDFLKNNSEIVYNFFKQNKEELRKKSIKIKNELRIKKKKKGF